MRQINGFEAVDGKIFFTEKECLDYEKSIAENVETYTEVEPIIQGVVKTEVTTYTRYKGLSGEYVDTYGYLEINGVWKVSMDEMLMYSYADHAKPEYLTKDFHSSQEEFITKVLNALQRTFSMKSLKCSLEHIRQEVYGTRAHFSYSDDKVVISDLPGDMVIEYVYEG